MRLLLSWLALTVCACAANFDRQLLRLAEEAQVFSYLAPKVIGQEKLEQVAMEPVPRFRARGARLEIPYRRREIISEYGYSTFKDDPSNLHELRQVVSVDGRQLKSRTKARETLTMGMRGDNDKLKKKMLKDFEAFGLREAATDFGQIILLFTQAGQANLDLKFLRNDYIGPERAIVFSYAQKVGEQAMTVFEGRRAVRHQLRGEVWLRESDGLPLRVTIGAEREAVKSDDDKDQVLKYAAVIDYQNSPHGLVLPVAVKYNETLDALLLIENRFSYSDFKMFGASSEIKFTVEDLPPSPPPVQKKK
ncbi:MAG: hypothetical protein SFV51_22225 [Bryobacteraceae bacterium]|nr:hypothetical protein [Bryobacteraceae bacterium]